MVDWFKSLNFDFKLKTLELITKILAGLAVPLIIYAFSNDQFNKQVNIKEQKITINNNSIEDKKNTNLKRTNKRTYQKHYPTIDSEIKGYFDGWNGETIVRLKNGQIWRQASNRYQSTDNCKGFRLKGDNLKLVIFSESEGLFFKEEIRKMKIDNSCSDAIKVIRIK